MKASKVFVIAMSITWIAMNYIAYKICFVEIIANDFFIIFGVAIMYILSTICFSGSVYLLKQELKEKKQKARILSFYSHL